MRHTTAARLNLVFVDLAVVGILVEADGHVRAVEASLRSGVVFLAGSCAPHWRLEITHLRLGAQLSCVLRRLGFGLRGCRRSGGSSLLRLCWTLVWTE